MCSRGLLAVAVLVGCGNGPHDEGKAALAAFREFVMKTYAENVIEGTLCKFRTDVRATQAVEQPYEGLLHVDITLVDADGRVNPFGKALDLVFDRVGVGWECSESRSSSPNTELHGGPTACFVLEERCKPSTEHDRERRRREATAPLLRIGKAAKQAYDHDSRFPVGAVALTPAVPCCQGPRHKCPVNASLWNDHAVWKLLNFTIEEPTSYQFSYRSDGNSLTAFAVGDPDCNGNAVTFELKGGVSNGNSFATVTGPTPSGGTATEGGRQ